MTSGPAKPRQLHQAGGARRRGDFLGAVRGLMAFPLSEVLPLLHRAKVSLDKLIVLS